MGLILTLLLFLLVRTSLMQNETLNCTNVDKSSLVVGVPSYACSQMIEDLARACGDFTSCALKYSYPMCLCDVCAVHYHAVKRYYDNIKNYDTRINVTTTREKECENLLFRDDGVEAVESIYNLVISLWDGADCDSCKNYTDDDIQGFFYRVSETLDCWAEYILDSIPIEESDGFNSDAVSLRKDIIDGKGLNVSHAVCTNCSHLYHNLSSYYDDKYKHHSACADIKFHMEMIRIQWSKSFGCEKPKKDLSFIVGIIIGFAVLLVVFYGGVNLYGHQQEKKEKIIYSVNPSSDRHFEITDTIDHDHPQSPVVREQTARYVSRTSIN